MLTGKLNMMIALKHSDVAVPAVQILNDTFNLRSALTLSLKIKCEKISQDAKCSL